MDNEDQLAQALRRLQHYQSIAMKLIVIADSARELWPVLERKICQLEELILEIPEVYEETIEDWRNEVYILWNRYSNAIRVFREARHIFDSLHEDSESLEPSFDMIKSTDDNGPASTESSSSGINESLSALGTGSSVQENVDDQQEKIYDSLDRDLEKVPPVKNATEIEAMNELLNVTAKYAKLSKIFWTAEHFQLELFNLVTKKLPKALLEEYLDLFDSDINCKRLTELKIFIGDKISEQYKAENTRRLALAAPRRLAPGQQFCAYCKEVGHYIDDCPKVTQRQCFKCWGVGHKAKFCPA